VTVAERGFVLISETYIPGWRVSVDGSETRVLQTNDIFIGVPLDAGTHSLKVEFKAQNYDLGLASTLIGLAGVAVLLLTKQIKATLTKLSGYRHRRENRV
jgi:uncharacterized membrane protein YfhO